MEVDVRLELIVDGLMRNYGECEGSIKYDYAYQLNRSAIIGVIDTLRELIFPGYFGKKNISSDFLAYHTGELLEEVVFTLSKEIERALRHRKDAEGAVEGVFKARADGIVAEFLSRLGDVRRVLAADVDATFDGDPAANSRDEIVSSYPGIFAIMVNRLAHVLYLLDVPLIPRMMTEHAHSLTGIDINPGATIGRRFCIDHGTGIVVGETTVIGNNVKVYQGVTLGALSTRDGQALKSVKRHPTIEDNVTIYSGASILGGSTVIGEGTVIGSNAFVTKSVPSGTRVSMRNPELRFTTKRECDGCQDISCTELAQEAFWDYQI
ncbi:MAG: serine O-acetyltransferase [Spirochaetaceae bacterium]|jgi:serine O-acetyltransferase|nr:serine O-acetyltransferase [Spirochaetaceae bacterium]